MSGRSRRWIGAVVVAVGIGLLYLTASIGEVMLGWQLFPRASGPGALWSVIALVLATAGIITMIGGVVILRQAFRE